MSQYNRNTQTDNARTVSFLNHAFAKASRSRLGNNNTKGTDLYRYQVEFAYLIDEIERGSAPSSQKAVVDANRLIEEIEALPEVG